MMNSRFIFRSLAALLALIILALVQPSLFADDSSQVPPPDGEQCVEPTDIMRKKHYEFILHQRDDTVLHGIRTKKHSFTGCIDCHITADKNGQYARYSEPDKHFCANCHEYAAVNIDCFQCHADRPEKVIRAEKAAQLSKWRHLESSNQKLDLRILSSAEIQ